MKNTELEHQLFDQTLDTLRLALSHFDHQGYKGAYVLALAIDHLKLELNLELLDEVREQLAEIKEEGGVFFTPSEPRFFIPSSDELQVVQ